MPTLIQLQAEPYWGREVVSDELDRLADRLCEAFGRSRDAFGTKGNERHLRGAHRSQEWIQRSVHCTNRSYTVQSGLSAWQQRLIAGGDFTPAGWGTSANRALMVQITGRCITAAKANRLPGVIEIGGTLDGRNPTGWHVVQRRVLNFDSSHVDHLHLTLDRRRLEDRAVMDNLFNVITGDDMAEEWGNYPRPAGIGDRPWSVLLADLWGQVYLGGSPWDGAKAALPRYLDRLEAAAAAEKTRDAATAAALAAIAEAIRSGGGNLEIAPILARIDERTAEVRADVEQRHQVEMAAVAELHQTQLAERDAEVAGLRAELERLTAPAPARANEG